MPNHISNHIAAGSHQSSSQNSTKNTVQNTAANTVPGWVQDIKLITWDLDGTLYPATNKLRQAIRQQQLAAVANKHDLDLPAAAQKFDQLYQQLRSTTKTLTNLGLNGHQFYLDLWQQLDLGQYVQPNPALQQKLAAIHRSSRWQQYLLTNSNDQAAIELKLNCLGISSEVFDRLFNSIDLGHNKPDKEAFACLWETSGYKPAEIVYIGDRDQTDIEPAKQYGLRAIKIDPQHTKITLTAPPTSPADLVLPNAVAAADIFLQS